MAAQVATPAPAAEQLIEKDAQSDNTIDEKATDDLIDYKYGGSTFSKDELLDPNFKTPNLDEMVRESIILSAGVAAILLQVAHPGVGAGVNEHSNFTYRIMDRLRTTMTFVYCMEFGTPEEKKVVANMINNIHGGVTGTLKHGKDKGKQYAALDPELQKWVAATLYATGEVVHEAAFGNIHSEEKKERIYQEYSRVAVALQITPERWPATRKLFWEYWDHMCNTIEVTEDAKEIGRDLLSLKGAPIWARAMMPSIRVVTAEWLPERIRIAFGVKRRPKTYKLLEKMVRAIYPRLPLKIRTYLPNHYLKDMRKRLANHVKVFEKDTGSV